MSRPYIYRHEIQTERYPELSDQDRAMIEAAWEVAAQAHAGVSRNKIKPQWDYICHPIMVCDILYRMGERDPVLLASALTHDALERGSHLHANPTGMKNELILAMQKRGMQDDVSKMAGRIVRLTKAVTNPDEFPQGNKENYQVDRASEMTLPAKKLKIIDQVASLICNVTMENDPQKFTHAQAMQFSDKAVSLVVAIMRSSGQHPGQREALEPYEWLTGRVMLSNGPLLAATDKDTQCRIRKHFDFEAVVRSNTPVRLIPDPPNVYFQCNVPGFPMDMRSERGRSRTGLQSVDFDSEGHVASYTLSTNQHPAGEGVKGLHSQFTAALRKKQRLVHGDTTDYLPHHGVLEVGEPTIVRDAQGRTEWSSRIYRLSPAMPLDGFLKIAMDSNACSRADTRALTTVAGVMFGERGR